jgi:hypothetical protein
MLALKGLVETSLTGFWWASMMPCVGCQRVQFMSQHLIDPSHEALTNNEPLTDRAETQSLCALITAEQLKLDDGCTE